MRRLGIVALLAVLVAGIALSALSQTEAAKGGRGKNHDGGSSSASLTVNPAAPRAGGDAYTLSGAGFKADAPVYLSIHEPFCCGSTRPWTDANGNFATLRTTKTAGTYTIHAYQYKGKKLVLAATISFDVID